MSFDRQISASLLRVRLKSPFFATIALHARYIESTEVATAATDGCDVFVNREFIDALAPEHLDGVLLHEVLHAALGHVTRRGNRDPQSWNVAADIVVNGLVTQNGFALPDGAIRDHELEGYSTEEVYAVLQTRSNNPELSDMDLMEAGPGVAAGNADPEHSVRPPGAATGKAQERHWRSATARAASVARGAGQGTLPVGVARAFGLHDAPTLDWRTILWRFLSPTATDFAAFDRRHIHQGLYLETLEDQGLRIAVAVDTSGSIDDDAISALITEVRAVVASYPAIECWLYYADAELHGPWKLTATSDMPVPQGGGGTDFRPFFAALHLWAVEEGPPPSVCIYLTDGYGDFPTEVPDVPTLWAVVPGGLEDDRFPFGEVARIF